MTSKDIKLSILVPTTDSRRNSFLPKILDQIFEQVGDREDIEVIVFMDNKKRTIGEKRNDMLSMCKGEYVIHVDCDDRLHKDYLSEILRGIEKGADVVTFKSMVTINGGSSKECVYSTGIEKEANEETQYLRFPNHICCVKTYLAKHVGFPNLQKGEDTDYAVRLKPYLNTEFHIPKVLYFYDYEDSTTETQMNSEPPIVDLVILSKGDSTDKVRMTQKTIDTAIQGAYGYKLKVIVVEQNPDVTYQRANVVNPYEKEFNYNKFMNFGAALGKAPWIFFANNDLEFKEGWLKPLLELGGRVVSPWEPNDVRMKDITRNTLGTRVGRHFAGWGFMMERSLWNSIGGLSTVTKFWCSDNSVVEQILEKQVYPMVVKDSVVIHLGSQSLNSIEDADLKSDYTWGDVHRFNIHYGKDLFKDNKWFKQWKERK